MCSLRVSVGQGGETQGRYCLQGVACLMEEAEKSPTTVVGVNYRAKVDTLLGASPTLETRPEFRVMEF